MNQGTTQPIQLPDNQSVTFAAKIKRLVQSRAIGLTATDTLISENLFTTRRS